ncbi:hypothetical protein LTR41_011790 [Exophiala xenobiotica]|nr:hypothetical protein LTR41_011790 [Exophiala xenobiotica]KAK5550354.1 hypothetical protein LTR46_011641 [Exophiala xenobiotica]
MSSSGGSAPGEFAHGKVDPHEAGKKGGLASGGGTSGGSDTSTTSSAGGGSGNTGGSQKGEFAHGKVDPSEAGQKDFIPQNIMKPDSHIFWRLKESHAFNKRKDD